MDTLWHDLRYALRQLLRTPAFTLAAVVTLGLGIAGATTVFTALRATLLRPLPFREPERLVMLDVTAPPAPGAVSSDTLPWSYPKFELMRRSVTRFESTAGFTPRTLTLGGSDPSQINVEAVSQSYLPLLGVQPAMGRNFLPEEEVRGAVPVVLLAHDFWRTRFGADRAILGRTVRLNDASVTVVGVLPQGFHGLSGTADLWMTIPTYAGLTAFTGILDQRWAHWLRVVGRLKPMVTLSDARADMVNAGRQVDAEFPSPVGGSPWGATLVPLGEAAINPLGRRAVLVLTGAVAFLLLIACANIANLQLSRAIARRRETAVRSALGAGRGRLIRQMLTESLVLALLGGVLGVLGAFWMTDLLRVVWPQALGLAGSRTLQFVDPALLKIDGVVLLVATAIALGTGIFFGLIPALGASASSLTSSLKDGGRSSLGGLGSLRRPNTRGALVALEVALALVLLVGAGLMVRSFSRLANLEPGFEPRHLLTFQYSLTGADSGTTNPAAFHEMLMARLGALPGVRDVTLDTCTPLSHECDITGVSRIVGRPPIDEGSAPLIGVHYVDARYFQTLAIPLLRGRTLTPQDRAGAPLAMIINETAARKFFPGENAVGHRMGIGIGAFSDSAAEIVGVVGDVKYGALEDDPRPEAYVPLLQVPDLRGLMVMVRTVGDPRALIPSVRRAVVALHPDLPIYDVKTMEDRGAEANARTRASTMLLGFFAAVALGLAAVGIYGVIAYSVGQSTREVGLRIALGATRADVLSLVLGRGMIMVATGAFVGLIAALILSRFLASLLYGVTATDPATFGLITALLAAVALAAALLPARRATRVDPMVALRSE